MTVPAVEAGPPEDSGRSPSGGVALWGVIGAIALIATSMLVPVLTGWDPRVTFPPLSSVWMPRLSPSLPAAILIGVLGICYGPRIAATVGWHRLLLLTFAVSLVWMLSLALVDGISGVSRVLANKNEYLPTAHQISDFGLALRDFVARIPLRSPQNWAVHVAGHPPGALLFFWVLTRVGLGSGLAAGLIVTLLGATIPVGVLATLRVLGAEREARRAAPLLVFTPAAIWICVSADGMFTAVAVWGVYALARAATTRSRGHGVAALTAWSVLAGVLLGYCVMLSYGLPLLGVLALAVLVAARDWRPLPIAAAAALAVVLLFVAGGFAWWEAYPVLQQRYWDGDASKRPGGYWVWGNLAAFSISAGPAVGAALAAGVWSGVHSAQRRGSPGTRTIMLLAAAGWLMVALADISNMSRSEVERIWLPFVPWVTTALALFGPRSRHWLLVMHVVFAVTVQSLLWTRW